MNSKFFKTRSLVSNCEAAIPVATDTIILNSNIIQTGADMKYNIYAAIMNIVTASNPINTSPSILSISFLTLKY